MVINTCLQVIAIWSSQQSFNNYINSNAIIQKLVGAKKQKTKNKWKLRSTTDSAIVLSMFMLPFKLFGFLIFRFWAYLMKVIPETRRAH